MRGNLTFNLGVRYEYVSPFSRNQQSHREPRFAARALPLRRCRCKWAQSGPTTGAYPITLVRPDRNNFAPRVGIAWKPLKNTVVRAGYGINYNTSAYQTIAQDLAFQPPFSITADQYSIRQPHI